MSHPTRPRRAGALVLAAALLALGACSGSGDGEDDAGPGTSTESTAPAEAATSSDGEPGNPAGPEVPVDDSDDHADQRYVALGDSYTSAPGVEPLDEADEACGRSLVNYPRLVQGAFGGSELVDVSCSGATTADVIYPQQTGGATVPAQIDAVTAETTVVTLSTGGNDFGAFAVLSGQCNTPGTPGCPELTVEGAQRALDEIQTSLVDTIGQISERAPQARVLVVGYPQIIPADTLACGDELPLPAEALGLARVVNEQLAAMQQRAAETAGAEYVDVFAATEGHDLCSDEPWINGGDWDFAAPYHPLAAEQRAAALAVIETLQTPQR